MKNDDKIIQAIDKILTFLQEGFISDEHRHAEINWDCSECKIRILEGGLEWLKDSLKDELDDKENNEDISVDNSHLMI